jgi:hypothetical protein
MSGAATVGSCTVTALSTTLNVTSVSAGFLFSGQLLADTTAALAPGTTITSQLTSQIPGINGGIGTYALSNQQIVASEAMTTSLVVSAQVQAMTTRDIRQMEGINLQGTLRAIYLTGDFNGVVRPLLKGGDLVTFPDGTVWLVTVVSEPWKNTAGWTKIIVTLQDGS